MKSIRFSEHALFKMKLFEEHGLKVSKEFVKQCLEFSDRIERGYGNRKIAQKVFDEEHVIRVIYEERETEILVITLYPGRRERYEKDQVQ